MVHPIVAAIISYIKNKRRIVDSRPNLKPDEFRVVVDLLRHERPIWWDEPTGRLYASREPVGEGE